MRSRIGKTAHARGEELLTCREVITFLHEFLAQELTPEEEREFRRHLAVCPSCLAYLETYERAVTLARAAFREDGAAQPPALSAELVRAILQARS